MRKSGGVQQGASPRQVPETPAPIEKDRSEYTEIKLWEQRTFLSSCRFGRQLSGRFVRTCFVFRKYRWLFLGEITRKPLLGIYCNSSMMSKRSSIFLLNIFLGQYALSHTTQKQVFRPSLLTCATRHCMIHIISKLVYGKCTTKRGHKVMWAQADVESF